MKRTCLLYLVAVIFTACSGPRVTLAPEVKGQKHRIAVLPFKSRGFLSSQQFGAFCADAFARELVHRKRAVVVDRALANAVAVDRRLHSTGTMSRDDLQAFNHRLGVTIVVLGEIQNSQERQLEFGKQPYRLLITARLLDTKTGTIIGVVSHERSGQHDLHHAVSAVIRDMVSSLGDLRLPENGGSEDIADAGNHN